MIKYAHDNDVWFHVDKLSSAHVYLRLPEIVSESQDGLFIDKISWDDIPDDILEDIAQLTKANSIDGNVFINLHLSVDNQSYT